MAAMRILSVYETLRPCLKCGSEFYPPRLGPGIITDYCGAACEKQAGLRPMKRPAAAPTGQFLRQKPRLIDPQKVVRPEPARPTLARALISHRRRLGWKRPAMATRLGVSIGSIRNWETGLFEPSAGHLAALADLFDVAMDTLWYGDGQEAP